MEEFNVIKEKSRKGILTIITFLLSFILLVSWGNSLYGKTFFISEIDDYSSLIPPLPIEKEDQLEKQSPQLQNNKLSVKQISTRVDNIQRIEESPVRPPLTINSIPNVKQRPLGDFKIGDRDFDSVNKGRISNDNKESGLGNVSSNDNEESVPEVIKTPKPTPTPTIIKEKEELPKIKQSLGIVNSKALNLVKPVYPAVAKATRTEGSVTVNIKINRNGDVTVINAIGHPLLTSAAKQAASQSKFSPTLLSKEAVEATGQIIYNFKL